MVNNCDSLGRNAWIQLIGALTLVVGMLTGVGTGGPTTARADSGSVRYSYEKVEIGDRVQWVLVPRAASSLQGEVTTDRVREAFELLRDSKETTYGETSITVDGQAPENMTATVEIDPDYERYKLIIIAESVYTLTELGVDEVTFPGYAEGVVTREDVPFSAYTVTLPLWRALPKTNLVDAHIRMPDGTVRSAEDVYRKWEQDTSNLREALYTYLDSSRDYTVQEVTKRLPEIGVPYVDQVLPLLEHESRTVRKTALETLESERNQEKVLKGVVSLMESEQRAPLARQAAEFLGQADNRAYSVQRWFFRLERGDDEERVTAAQELGDWSGDDRVPKRLAEALMAPNETESGSNGPKQGDTEQSDTDGDENTENDGDDATSGDDETSKSQKTSRPIETFESALVESLAQHDAHEVLARGLDNKNVLETTQRKIADTLADDSQPEARIPGLRYLAANADGRRAREAIRTLGQLDRPKARKTVEEFLTTSGRRLRNTAIETIRSIGSSDSVSAIADAIRRAEKSSEKLANLGYQILSEQTIPDVLESTRASDTIVQRMAYRALGAKAEQGTPTDQIFETIFEQLEKGADHSDPQIRGAAARGLGALGNDQALEVLKTLADDSSAEVREGVAYALGNYERGDMSTTLNGYLDDDSPRVVAAALESLRERSEGDARDKMKTLAENTDNPKVKQRALEAIAQLVPDEDEARREVISLLSGTVTSADNSDVLRTALSQLGRFSKERAVNGIAISLNSGNKDLKMTAIRALGRTGHESAKELVLEQLEDSDPAIRRAAVKALGDLGDPSVRSNLQQRLTQEKNESIKTLIQETLEAL